MCTKELAARGTHSVEYKNSILSINMLHISIVYFARIMKINLCDDSRCGVTKLYLIPTMWINTWDGTSVRDFYFWLWPPGAIGMAK